MKKLALLLVGVLGTAFCTFAKSTTEPVDYVKSTGRYPVKACFIYRKYISGYCHALGNELLGGTNRKDGGWMGLYL